jgi:L-alanine-DL-glutamate epimerase-like enolase superfamily enzyme
MKIVQIEAIPFVIPYRKPLRFASGEVHVADHVLVQVHSDDGLIGVAGAPPRPYTCGETEESIVAVIEKIFAPELVGLSAALHLPVFVATVTIGVNATNVLGRAGLVSEGH